MMLKTFIPLGISVLLFACAPADIPPAEPAQTAQEAAEEPIPPLWRGTFSMVEVRNGPRGGGQFQLVLGQQGPNHFLARRGCYSREGWLKRRGDVWIVERRGDIRVDQQCLAGPHHKGSPEGLFDHQAVQLSAGPERWISEGATSWMFIPHPPSPPGAAGTYQRPTAPPAPAMPALSGSEPLQLSPSLYDAAEALYRHQIKNNASGGQQNVATICLGTGGGINVPDPPKAVVARFAGHRPPVKAASSCRWDDIRWRDRITGGDAIVHYIRDLSCASAAS